MSVVLFVVLADIIYKLYNSIGCKKIMYLQILDSAAPIYTLIRKFKISDVVRIYLINESS